jgi:hypothetical protein
MNVFRFQVGRDIFSSCRYVQNAGPQNWRALKKAVMNLRVLKKVGNFLAS